MKMSHKNIDLICNTLHEQMEDESGRGEFDKETDLVDAVKQVIEWIEYEKTNKIDKVI